MVEFIPVLFVLSFFFFFILFFFPRSFSQFLHLPFFLPLSWCLAFLNSLSKFLHLSVHIVGDRSNPFSLIFNEIYSYKCLFDFGLDPRLGSCLGPMSQLASWEPWLRLRLHGPRHCHYYRWESFVGAGSESGCECEGEAEEHGEVAGCRRRCHHVGFQVDPKPLSLLTFSFHSLFIWGWVCCISFGFLINLKRDNMGLWKEIFWVCDREFVGFVYKGICWVCENV